MKCRLAQFLTALSLLLLAAVVMLWVRSYRHQDMIGFGFWGHDSAERENQERWFAGIEGYDGVLALGVLRERQGGAFQGSLVRSSSGFFWNNHGWPLNSFIGAADDHFGFECIVPAYPPSQGYLGHHGVIVCVPFWAAVGIAGVVSVTGCRRLHRHGRLRREAA